MIKRLIGLGRGVSNVEIVNKRFTRYMQPIINVSLDAGTIDSSQAWLLDVVETSTEWVVIYNMANTQPVNYFGQVYANNDTSGVVRKTKSNNVLTGWEKTRDVNGDPKPFFPASFINERFDEWQAWIRTVIIENGIWKIWWVGDSGYPTTTAFPPPFSYRVGYAESHDEGLTYTNRTTTPIYVDDDMSPGQGAGEGGLSQGIVVLQVVHDDINYKMIYAGVDPNIRGLFIAESANGITGWTRTYEGLFANQEYGFPSGFKYANGTYYLWLQRHQMMPEGNLGPCREVLVFSITGSLSADYRDWTNHGVQIKLKNVAQEFGVGNHFKVLQKPNGEWFALYTYYTNRTQAIAGITKEPALGIKLAESNNTDSFIMNSTCRFSWPSYVTFHAPLDTESGFAEEIRQVSGILTGTGHAYAERGFLRLSGTQTITFPNNGTVINGAHFSVKMRIEIITSGNRELFKIGNDIIMTIEDGKLRVRLSSDGVSYQKDFITTVNISKPLGLDYVDNHIYVGFMWNGTTIRMWNDFVEFTIGEITKTVDNALTVVNNSGDDILIGQNSAIELRSVSVCSEITATEFMELDI
jgi:hypothetical protein